MRSNRMRIWVAKSFYYSGLVPLVRWWTQRSHSSLIILCYHRASGGDLRSHFAYFGRHYRVLPLETALETLYKGQRRGQERRDQRTLLALTFDDGYKDNYTHAFSLACELKVPITIFLVPGYIGTGSCFWWLEVDRLVRHAQVEAPEIDGRTYHLANQAEREALARVIYTSACDAKSVAEREAFLLRVERALATSPTLPGEDEAVLNWQEIREMDESQGVSFGAHTMHHPVLAYLTDPPDLRFEVEECRATLEEQLGHPVRSFAYPLGKPEHVGDRAVRAVRQAGYDWALTTVPGRNTGSTDPYLLRRNIAGPNQHWLVVAAATAGVWGFFSRLYGTAAPLIRKCRVKELISLCAQARDAARPKTCG